MRGLFAVFKRELAGYFATPLAYIFIVIFLALVGALTFVLSQFYDAGQATLQSAFAWHPWLYLLLVPAIGMRLWAEERRSGTIEFLMTLPITVTQAVWGKFLAAWVFCLLALALTFPLWITVNYLGDADNGVILASYIGSGLMSGAFLAVCAPVSALTRNQVIAFVVGALVCFLLIVANLDLVTGLVRWLGGSNTMVDAVASLSVLSHFDAITRGVIEARTLVFFFSVIAFGLFANVVAVSARKAA